MKKLLFTLAIILLFSTPAMALIRYVNPACANGITTAIGTSACTGGSDTVHDTIQHATDVVNPGDTVIIKDGTYYQSLNITVSGTQANPITIKAENDGQVTIDGQNNRIPCRIYGSSSRMHDITVEGMICKNSSYEIFQVYYADRITIKRVSAYNAAPQDLSANAHPFSISATTYTLLEDCVASGTGRVMFNILSCDHITVRRCFGAAVNHNDVIILLQIYGSDNTIVDNFIGTSRNASKNVWGVHWQTNTYNYHNNYNKVYGSIIYNIHYLAYSNRSHQHNIYGNRCYNSVSINNGAGFWQGGDSDMVIDQMTAVGTNYSSGTDSFWVSDNKDEFQKDSDFYVNNTTKNSVIYKGTGISSTGMAKYNVLGRVQSFNHTYNTISGFTNTYFNTTQGIGEITTVPNYDTATYGKGAYLIRPSNLKGLGESGADIGAEVLYRYQDGILTNQHLWPWPMEDRIKAETGYSVTWEADGGLWKTLDGIPTGTDTTPPSIPVNVAAADTGTTTMLITWDVSTGSPAGYDIYRCTGVSCTPTDLLYHGVTSNSYNDSGLTANTTYCYAVKAYDAANNISDMSSSACDATDANPIVPPGTWTLVSVDSEELVEENDPATNAFDGNPATYWHTTWGTGGTDPLPHTININMNESIIVTGFNYLPRQSGTLNGTIAGYEFYTSVNGTDWTLAASGTWANNRLEKSVTFTGVTASYIRLKAISEVNGNPWTSAAEITVVKGIAPSPYYTAKFTNQAMTVDGVCTEYSGANSITIENMIAKFLYTVTDIYLCATAADTNVSSTQSRDGSLYADDSLQILFSPTNHKTSSFASTDYQIIIGANGNKMDYNGALGLSKDVPLYSRSVVTGTINNPADTDTGYVIEMRIPLSTISPTIPVGGTTWGLLLFENNGSQQIYTQKSWPDGVAVGSYMNPSLWGSMIFEIANIPNLRLQ